MKANFIIEYYNIEEDQNVVARVSAESVAEIMSRINEAQRVSKAREARGGWIVMPILGISLDRGFTLCPCCGQFTHAKG